MAPLDPAFTNSNLAPTSLFLAYLAASIGLTTLVCRAKVFTAFRNLPPSQDTRFRQSNRQKHVRLFAWLASISLATAWYQLARILILSYHAWAHNMNEALPTWPYSLDSYNRLMLGRWLADTAPLSVDAWEIIMEGGTRFWWAQQLFLGTGAWAVFVGIEGKRRRIRHLWAYILLGPLVARSFAMNLFFLAVLLAPVPLPARGSSKKASHVRSASQATDQAPTPSVLTLIFDWMKLHLSPLPTHPHPEDWHPYPWEVLLQLSALHVITWLLPYTTGTPLFNGLILANFAILFRVVYPNRLAPFARGSRSFTPTQLKHNYLKTYRWIAIGSLALHAKQTFVAIIDNDPGAHRHRHSEYLAMLHLPHEKERGMFARTLLAVDGVLQTLGNHPATARIGWDVLLCAITLATWAAVRGLDVHKMFAATGFGKIPDMVEAVAETASSTVAKAKPGRKRRSKATEDVLEDERAEDDRAAEDDETYQPVEGQDNTWHGEEEDSQDAEAGAVAGAMFVVGGLGVLSSAVLGAEDI